eukprot:scaffold1698_cov149-Skeletonema_menzelii.AAC.28
MRHPGPDDLKELPTNPDDFDEPDWVKIIETAFPPWETPENGCHRLTELGGELDPDYAAFPTPQEGKWNPCYYTKAFAGLHPILDGYPTPIDTRYPYEFAAPFHQQPGDGSTHHCPDDAPADIDIRSCPKIRIDCGPNCVELRDDNEFSPIGHVPAFVPLAAVKKAYNSGEHDVCNEWFDFETRGCHIKIDKLDELVIDNFGDGNQIKFQPPVLIGGDLPSSTYYKLEYSFESPACDSGNCRGPHYCTKEVAEAGIWGEFCPYVHTGENSGLYRHPHLALVALELWIAHQCMPSKCPSKWLDSPDGVGYGQIGVETTGITWIEMDDNMNPMTQPALPYTWPNAGGQNSIFPGIQELYGESASKEGIAAVS